MPKKAKLRATVAASPLLNGLLGWWRLTPSSLGQLRVPSLVDGTPAVQDSNTGSYFSRSLRGRPQHPGGVAGFFFDNSNGERLNCGTRIGGTVQDHSVAGWVYLLDGTAQYMLAARSSNITAGGWEWRCSSEFRYAYFGGGGVNGWYTGPTLAVGQWVHLVGVWHQAAGSVEFTVNGVLSSTVATATATITHSASDELWWGNQPNNLVLNGYLDDLMLWGRALSTAEASQVYASALAGHPNVLLSGAGSVPLPPPGTDGSVGSTGADGCIIRYNVLLGVYE